MVKSSNCEIEITEALRTKLLRLQEPKIVILNGPPRSGKDTMVSAVTGIFPLSIAGLKMAKPLKDACFAALGITDFPIQRAMDNKYKDRAMSEFLPVNSSMTWREFQIHMSEEVMKPLFGKEVFGQIATARIADMVECTGVKFYLFSDGGFEDELRPLVRKFKAENVLIVRLHREGCDFSLDSRGDLKIAARHLGLQFEELRNDGGVLEATKELISILNDFMGGDTSGK